MIETPMPENDRDILLKGSVFSVERVMVPLSDGTRAQREIVRHPGAVCVIGVLDDGRLVTIENFRVAVGAWMTEFCAGKLEPGEDPRDAAARELEEETGYRANRIESLGSFYTSPGFADEIMHAFVATGLTPCTLRLEPDERIRVKITSVKEFSDAIASGGVRDGKSISSFFLWTLRHR